MSVRRVHFLAIGIATLALCFGSASRADDAKRKAYGAYLARECTACHRLDGIDNGIPSIVGWESERLVATLRFYQQGLRPNPAMISVARSLDETQLQALAAYFSSLPSPAKKPSAPPAKGR